MFQNRVHTSVTQLLRKVPVIVFPTIFIKALCHRDIEGMISYDIIPRSPLFKMYSLSLPSNSFDRIYMDVKSNKSQKEYVHTK